MLRYSSLFLFFALCGASFSATAQDNPKLLHQLNTLLINTVMQDVYTPPVASRIYAYPNIAFYECIRQGDTSLPEIFSQLNGFDPSFQLPAISDHQYIAACISFSVVAQKLVGSEEKFIDWRDHFQDSLKIFTDTSAINLAISKGQEVAAKILDWAKKDNYGPTRAMPRFTNSSNPGTWQLTPADYAPAIEPHWNEMRSFTLNSPSQFSPIEKLKYSANKKSIFFKTTMELYELTTHLDTAKKATAKYWDDNPNVSINLGHLNYFIHKISPGGHWLMIAKQACEENSVPVAKSSLAYSLTAIALYDAFICSWDEKYKTNLIRPITVINQFIDKEWEPYIQTPPFPEFTSGHAVISNSAATVLTNIFGDQYAFTDSTEIPFGNVPRHFNSFYEAAHEVTWSRVYGGIHYPETARISIIQGKNVGSYVIQKLYPGILAKKL